MSVDPDFVEPELMAAWQPMFPMHRMAKPEELCGAIIWLAVNLPDTQPVLISLSTELTLFFNFFNKHNKKGATHRLFSVSCAFLPYKQIILLSNKTF